MLIQFVDVARGVRLLRHRDLHHPEMIDMIVGLRVSPEVEVEGLDINLHGETVHG